MGYNRSKKRPLLGDTPAPTTALTVSDVVDNPAVKTATGVASLYHGYKRTGSIVWALVYGCAGRWFPLETVPIIVAQGFGQKKGG